MTLEWISSGFSRWWRMKWLTTLHLERAIHAIVTRRRSNRPRWKRHSQSFSYSHQCVERRTDLWQTHPSGIMAALSGVMVFNVKTFTYINYEPNSLITPSAGLFDEEGFFVCHAPQIPVHHLQLSGLEKDLHYSSGAATQLKQWYKINTRFSSYLQF